MIKTKAVSYFVAVSDISQPMEEQEGILLEVQSKGGDTPKNRAKALEMVTQMWEKGEIDDEHFPDGITSDNIFYVPPEDSSPAASESGVVKSELSPVVQGAQEIIQLTKLQIEVQEAATAVAPYTSIIEAVLDRTRPLTSEEQKLAKDKKYGKTIERIGSAIASQEEYQENCTGNGKLILNAISWQLNQSNE